MKVGISASIRGKLRVRTKVESRIMSHWGYLTEASCSREVSAPSRGNAAAGTVDREKQDTRPLDRCQSRAAPARATFRLTPPPPALSNLVLDILDGSSARGSRHPHRGSRHGSHAQGCDSGPDRPRRGDRPREGPREHPELHRR